VHEVAVTKHKLLDLINGYILSRLLFFLFSYFFFQWGIIFLPGPASDHDFLFTKALKEVKELEAWLKW
jgi:hypothetical protein